MSFKFKYLKEGKLEFPGAKIDIFCKSKGITLIALVDSGASVSVFKPEVAEILGIEIDKGKKTELLGVGGRIAGFEHKLDAEVAGRKFKLPIVFSHEYIVSVNLLGRSGFFEEFKIIFDEKKRTIILE